MLLLTFCVSSMDKVKQSKTFMVFFVSFFDFTCGLEISLGLLLKKRIKIQTSCFQKLDHSYKMPWIIYQRKGNFGTIWLKLLVSYILQV